MAAADKVISYFAGTKFLAIEYSGDSADDQQVFIASSDPVFADDPGTRRSSDGFLFQLYEGPVDWRAAKQQTVTTSSTEAEFLALSQAAKEAIWWDRFSESIEFDSSQKLVNLRPLLAHV